MPSVHGNLDGLRNTFIAQLERLYDLVLPQDIFCPRELMETLAAWSGRINREIAVYITRDGEVADVIVGELTSVSLPDLHLRRNIKRLSMVRCVHTHPGGSGLLSDVDESALRSLRFDAMCAIGVNGETPTDVSCGFLDAVEGPDGQNTILLEGPVSYKRLPQESWMDKILQADERVLVGAADAAEGPERALLVGMESMESLEELARLADTAGASVVGKELQKRLKPDTATYVGSGKAAELCLTCQALNVDVAIFDEELSGIQLRNLEDILGVKVIDRTALILDIFAQRASSREGKLQVELAQLSYQSARLIGMGLVLSRLAGGIGTRGPGETKLEMNRRRIRDRVTAVKRELDEMEKQRSVRRKSREKNKVPIVALVGYTNVGKSTLLNLISGAGVYVQDQLFATLDAVSRKVTLPDGGDFLLTDTVGFIRKLPTTLVSAFRSTLEEAALADVLLIVSDASSPDLLLQHKVVEDVLDELGATSQPRIEVINKCDKGIANDLLPGAICVSARENTGIDKLMQAIAASLRGMEEELTVHIPFDKMGLVNVIRSLGRITNEEYDETGEKVTFKITEGAKGQLLSRVDSSYFIN